MLPGVLLLSDVPNWTLYRVRPEAIEATENDCKAIFRTVSESAANSLTSAAAFVIERDITPIADKISRQIISKLAKKEHPMHPRIVNERTLPSTIAQDLGGENDMHGPDLAMEDRLEMVLTKLALRWEAVRQQARDRGEGMSM